MASEDGLIHSHLPSTEMSFSMKVNDYDWTLIKIAEIYLISTFVMYNGEQHICIHVHIHLKSVYPSVKQMCACIKSTLVWSFERAIYSPDLECKVCELGGFASFSRNKTLRVAFI